MKKGFFTQVQNQLIRSPKLNVHEKMIYIYLLSRQGNKKDSWPGHKRIASDLGISQSTVKKYLKSLEDFGLIDIKPQFYKNARGTNRYIAKISSPKLFVTPDLSSIETDPGSSGGYKEYSGKEDSYEEDSYLNTSSQMRKRKSWEYLDPDKPMTDSQKEYFIDLMTKTGDYNWEEALEQLNSYGDMSQVDGHDAIRENFITLKSIDDF